MDSKTTKESDVSNRRHGYYRTLSITQSLAEIIKTTILAIRKFGAQIDRLFKTTEDVEFFQALPGVGPCLGPRLLVAFGEDRKRFKNAAQLQAYTGVVLS